MALFRSKKSAESSADAGEQDVSALVAGPDSEWFIPRQTGIYRGGPSAYRYLRFAATGRVYVAGDDDGRRDVSAAQQLLGSHNPDPMVGVYTGAGRFVVQRRFERGVVFTVLASDDAGLTARITSTETNTTDEHRYDFAEDLP